MRNLSLRNKELMAIFFLFFKISVLTIGGGYAMVPSVERALLKKDLIEEEEFYDVLAITQSLPGSVIFNLSLLIGKKLKGFWGAMFASLGVMIPPFFAIIIIASLIQSYSDSIYIQKFLEGCYIATVGLTSLVSYKVIKNLNVNKINIFLFLLGVIILVFNRNLTFFIFVFLVVLNYLYEGGRIKC